MTTKYNGSGLKKVGFRIRGPNGLSKRVGSRIKAIDEATRLRLTATQCQLYRIGRSRNGATVDQPVAW